MGFVPPLFFSLFLQAPGYHKEAPLHHHIHGTTMVVFFTLDPKVMEVAGHDQTDSQDEYCFKIFFAIL